jgi:outer membrane protein assembly factor BamB
LVCAASLLLLGSSALADQQSGAAADRSLANSPWPMFQHDPQHTGRSQYVAPSRLALKWRAQVRGLPGSPAIGSDGTIYLPTGNTIVGEDADRQGFLYAINPDGSLRWRFEFPPTPLCVIVPTFTTPAVAADGTIYVHTESGRTSDGSGHCTSGPSFLYAINPDGSQKWAYQLNGGAAVFSGGDLSSPTIGADGTIYLTSRDTGVYAINPNGTLKWAVSPEATSLASSPAVGQDGTIYVNSSDLHAYTPNGVKKWAAQTDSSVPNNNSPSIGADGTIYTCGHTPDLCHAVSPTGSVMWSFPLKTNAIAPALAGEGTIYLADRENGLFAVNPDGTQRWHTLEDESGFSQASHTPVLGADGRLYVRDDAQILDDGSVSGLVTVLNPDGTTNESEPIPALFGFGGAELSSAVGSDGTLYVPQPRAGSGGYNPDDQYLAAYVDGPEPDGDFLDLAGKRTQRLGKVVKVKAECEVACTATGTGKLIVTSKRRVFKLGKDKESIAAGETETLKLKVRNRGRKTAERSLADEGKAKAKLAVVAVAAGGDSDRAKRTVKLK